MPPTLAQEQPLGGYRFTLWLVIVSLKIRNLVFAFFLALSPGAQDGAGSQHRLLFLLPTPKHSGSQTRAGVVAAWDSAPCHLFSAVLWV